MFSLYYVLFPYTSTTAAFYVTFLYIILISLFLLPYPFAVYYQHTSQKNLVKAKSTDIISLLKAPHQWKLKILKLSARLYMILLLMTSELISRSSHCSSPGSSQASLPVILQAWQTHSGLRVFALAFPSNMLFSHIHITGAFTSFSSLPKVTFSGRPPYQKCQHHLPPDIIYLLSLLLFFLFLAFFNT